MKALLYKGFRGILKNFEDSGTLLDSSVPLLQKVQSTKIKMQWIIIMVRVGEDQNTHLSHWKSDLGVLPNNVVITTEPSHRFTGAYQRLFLRLFWLQYKHRLNTFKTAYKRFLMINARDKPNMLTISVLWLLIPLSILFSNPSNRLYQFCACVHETDPQKGRKLTNWKH